MIEYDSIINTNTPLTKIDDPLINEIGIELFIKREDLNHPQLSGNKWYKLKYNLIEARKSGYNTMLTFGGAYSNHIYATAAAGKLFGFKTIGIIRGEEHLPLNPTLSFAKECGMDIHYMDRTTYRKKDTTIVIESLKEKFGMFYLLPEGGTNELAVKGCCEIPENIDADFDYICCACGTGGTMAGLISGLKEKKNVMGFAILKGANFLNNNVKIFLNESSNKNYKNWSINLDYHFGGYAKMNYDLINFVKRFIRINKIPIEPIYTGKMLYGIYDLVANRYFRKGEKIVAIHTGGLQGLAGLKHKIK
jgi:1-aminocyclopropane-1-carboxylate deaminase